MSHTTFCLCLSVLLVALTSAVKIKDCGSKSIKLHTYSVNPHPIKAPGVITINTHFSILNEIDAPVNLKLHVKSKFWFGWVPVPCVKQMGSCTYNQGCTKLKDILVGKGCPPEIEKWGLSCTCPLKAGEVNIVNKHVEIPDISGVLGSLAKGKYWVKAELQDANTGKNHVCVEVEAELR